MGSWIALGIKISTGIYVSLGALGIVHIILGINHSDYEWTQNQTVDAIIGFCAFYILMILFVQGVMERKLTKRLLLLDIPLAIIVAIGLIASMIFVEEQNITDLAFLMALLLSTPIILLFLRIGYKQWTFYSELKILLENKERQ
ncbi:hypothetical protein COF59_24300 [Bacillus pseudomycoides]|uniref:hypothetical protein n=1 Tax=Bacillus pseudomycoides TaxID=64104 RepID=UPI000BFE7B3C|nr:hypothetical protein [Bacillus pseudomycoides]PHE07149.1 hypothetical protein COF59_24300 [Bacillus pseudomycoides]